MRKLYCPICASNVQWTSLKFTCELGPCMSTKLGNQIRNAVYAVEPYSGEVRKPEIAPYLWCPNCTAPLEEHDDRERRFECSSCSLKLHILAHVELMELRSEHVCRDKEGNLFWNEE